MKKINARNALRYALSVGRMQMLFSIVTMLMRQEGEIDRKSIFQVMTGSANDKHHKSKRWSVRDTNQERGACSFPPWFCTTSASECFLGLFASLVLDSPLRKK